MKEFVATVLTVYGIETKREIRRRMPADCASLQQYLPFTVLKHLFHDVICELLTVATVLTVYGIETIRLYIFFDRSTMRCNSTYRLRY